MRQVYRVGLCSGNPTIALPITRPEAADRPMLHVMRKSPVKLYFVTSSDHGEDWFVIAEGARVARREHADHQGYDRKDVRAELVCELPEPWQGYPYLYATIELLQACGAEVRSVPGEARVVQIAGRAFMAGDIMEQEAVERGEKPSH